MYKNLLRSISALSLTSVLALSSPAFAEEMSLKIDGVKGESTSFKDEISATSFAWGFTQDASGRAVPQRFNVQKLVDSTSPVLLQRLLDGQVTKTLTFYIRKVASKPHTVAQIELSDVRVADVQAGGSNGTVPTEQVTFTFSKVHYQYFPIDAATGKPSTTVSVKWQGASQP